MKANLAQNDAQTDLNILQPGDYYTQVAALTPKEAIQKTNLPLGIDIYPLSWLFSPLLTYVTIGIFFTAFIGTIVWQIKNHFFNLRGTLTSLTLALVIAAIPISLRTVLQMTSFQTRAVPDEIPRQITLNQTSTNAYIVTWETDVEKTGSVRFGPAPLDPDTSRVIIANSGKKTRSHMAKLGGLEKGVVYELEILSGKEWYDNQGRPIQFALTSQ